MKEPRDKRLFISKVKLPNFYIICEREMKKPIGFFSLSDSKELQGFFIEPAYRRRGYATEVLQTLLDQDLLKVAITHPKNTPMRKLLEKLNFSLWLKYEIQEN